MSDIAKNVIWPGWETVRVIGRGSFGAVYEIQRDVAGETEKAALKHISIPKDKSEINMLRQQKYDDESITAYFTDYKGMFEREYSMMMRMKGHANIVYCEDIRTVQQDDGFGWDIYIKMELLEPLTEHINSGMTEEQIIKLGRDMCSALMYCEKMNVIHRDIKPENIFITREGNYKLGDFGIARTLEGTRTGTVTGTPSFMAPEVANNRRYNSTADIYSLGLTLYWLLNGHTGPFLTPGKKPTPSEKQAAQDRRLRGYSLPEPKYGSSKLNKVVLKACEYDPKERFQTAKEMLDELKKLIAPKHAAPAQSGRDRTENSRTTYRHTKSPTNNTAPKHRKNGTRKPRRKLKLLILADCILLIAALAIWAGFAKDRPERETLPMPTPEPTSIATPMPTSTSTPEPTPEPTPVPTPTYRVIDVASNRYQTVFLKPDGTLIAVGENYSGQCNVQSWTDIVAVSAGLDHTVGIRSDGTVVAAGDNEYGQCNVQGWRDIVAVSAGNFHTVGLKSDGTVVAVGWNTVGQLNVQNWHDIVAVSAGDVQTVGLKSDGTVVAAGWNYNDFGQLNIQHWTNIVAISTGADHVVGLKSNGTVVAVGDNRIGQCNVQNWTDIVAVSAGPWHTVGLKSDGTVVAVGGESSLNQQCDVQGWTDVIKIDAGFKYIKDWVPYTLGLKSDGSVLIATDGEEIRKEIENAIAQLEAQSITVEKAEIPEPTVGYTQISLGGGAWCPTEHILLLRSDGTVKAIGENVYGECNVENWTDIVAVSAGRQFSLGLKSNGTVAATGANDDGQCNVSRWFDMVDISAGNSQSVGLRSDGTVVSANNDIYNEDEVNNWRDVVDVDARDIYAVGLKADGTVVKNSWLAADTSCMEGIKQICSGTDHVVGLRADGTVVAVGGNENGECNVSEWKDIQAISACVYVTVGLKADGTVVATGYNGAGQCNVSHWRDVISISTNGARTVGLKADGSFYDTLNTSTEALWID